MTFLFCSLTIMLLDLFILSASTTQLYILSLVLTVLTYLSYVRYKRYQALNKMIQKYPDPNIVLKNHDIAMEIYSNIFRKEFPCKYFFK